MIREIIPSEIGGGDQELKQRTASEWTKLKHHIDSGQPWPITLIGTTSNPTHNHQVLAYGYKDMGPSQCTMFLYDNIYPDSQGSTTLDFTHDILQAVEVFPHVNRGDLRGFFCDDYQPAPPPRAVGLVQGIATSRARVSLKDTLVCEYEAQNLGFGISPPISLWVKVDLPPQPVGPHAPPPVGHPLGHRGTDRSM